MPHSGTRASHWLGLVTYEGRQPDVSTVHEEGARIRGFMGGGGPSLCQEKGHVLSAGLNRSISPITTTPASWITAIMH